MIFQFHIPLGTEVLWKGERKITRFVGTGGYYLVDPAVPMVGQVPGEWVNKDALENLYPERVTASIEFTRKLKCNQ